MRMSVPAWISLGLATVVVVFSYAINPDPGLLRTALPMLVLLAAIPLILNQMNMRQSDRVDMRDFKLYQIGDLAKLGAGTPVRLQGIVDATALKWLNRPNFQLSDKSGGIRVYMFAAPRENIKIGDRVDVAGNLRFFGRKKEKVIWGVRIQKIKP
ncbi:MAG: hypothetical protein PHT62_10200 [Desulfotomaculaceae bacterium]|nr:hypothetical protein [Desulfotomaculaceae bacterium]